jgi:hypothetical protein
MTDDTRVVIQTVESPTLYVPGPIASKVSCILTRIRDLAVEGGRFLRYAEESRLDIERLERIEEELHIATRPMRHGLVASTRDLASRARGVDMYAQHTDAEEADEHETKSGGSP